MVLKGPAGRSGGWCRQGDTAQALCAWEPGRGTIAGLILGFPVWISKSRQREPGILEDPGIQRSRNSLSVMGGQCGRGCWGQFCQRQSIHEGSWPAWGPWPWLCASHATSGFSASCPCPASELAAPALPGSWLTSRCPAAWASVGGSPWAGGDSVEPGQQRAESGTVEGQEEEQPAQPWTLAMAQARAHQATVRSVWGGQCLGLPGCFVHLPDFIRPWWCRTLGSSSLLPREQHLDLTLQNSLPDGEAIN